jgi:chitinase
MSEQITIDGPPADVAPDGADPIDAPPPRPSGGRHLSWFRVFLVAVVAAAAVTGTWFFGFHLNTATADAAGGSTSWFAPYVDVTATPQYSFEDVPASAPTGAVLAFVVSAAGAPCDPSWGAAYSMSSASDSLDLDRRLARLRQLGGAVTVSFGGAANSELSIGCTDPAQLTAAYQSVVDRYSVSAIDLDIEGSVASAPAVNERRALAIAAMTTQQAVDGHPVDVWLTLPVGPSGLTAEGLSVLTSMLAAKVPLAGVNGMTMDYGVPIEGSMATESEVALTALQQQVQSAYHAAGTDLSDAQSWQLVGATPMIGQNDVAGEIFGLADAQQLVAFGQQHRIGRMSMWSANRDKSCGPNYPDVHVVSDACSGVDQTPGQFAGIFATFQSGQPVAAVPTVSADASTAAQTSATAAAGNRATAEPDDPATSPYAIWNVNQAYPKGTKTVWHRNVYQAKWYSIGDQPDLPVSTADQTPWTLVGPVLPGDHPAPLQTLAPGTYPDWNATDVYVAGSRVLQDGVGYQAKYWTQGDVPGAVPTSPTETSPWELITS